MEIKSSTKILTLIGFSIWIAYLLPYHSYPYTAFYNDWLVAFSVIAFFVFALEQKSASLSLPWITIFPIGLSIIVALDAYFGKMEYAWDAIIPIGYFLIAGAALIIGASIAAEMEGAYALCNTLAISHLTAALCSAMIASMQLSGTESLSTELLVQMAHEPGIGIRPYGNLAQPNQLALLFCIGLCSVWWLYQAQKIEKFAGICATGVLLWGLALTQSRIAWIILPVFFLLLLNWRRSGSLRQVSCWVSGGGLLFYLLLVAILPKIALAIGADVDTALKHAQSSGHSPRITFIRQAWHISIQHPFLGAGWYEFGPKQLAVAADFPPVVYAQHAHNIVMNFAAEIGWPFTILFFGGLGYWLYAAYFRQRIRKESAFALMFLCTVSVHSMVEFPLWYAYVLLPTAILLGMVHQLQLADSKPVEIRRGVVALACIVAVAGMIGIATDYRQVVLGFRALGWENLGMHADEGTTKAPKFTTFPEYFDYLHFAKTQAHKDMTALEIKRAERVMRRFGYAPVLMRMSLIYALNKRSKDAIKTMIVLNKLHPDRYAEAYEAWQRLAKTGNDAKLYADIFKKFPVPAKPAA